MYNFLAIIGIGIASNLDNAGVGIAYGVKHTKIQLIANIIIALMGFSLALIGGLFGNWISLWLSPQICQLISMAVLVIIGVWVLCQQFLSKTTIENSPNHNFVVRILRNLEEADFDKSKTIGILESIVLGIALSVNNLAGGFSAGITHLDIWTTALISGVFSFMTIGLCVMFGFKFASGRLGDKASAVSGIMLILIGLRQIM